MSSKTDIVLVSTEPVIQQLLERVLESMQLRLRLVASTSEIELLALERETDLLIVDLQRDAIAEAQWAAAFLERTEKGAVLLLSNTRSPLTPHVLQNNPRCICLTKPAEITELKKAIRQLLPNAK